MLRLEQRDWKSPIFDCLCPTAIDWAMMAAFIDGEGSILINTQKNKRGEVRGFYLRVMVANTDVRLMHWLQERFGGTFKDANTAKYYEGKNWKRAYHWGASAHRGAWILQNCLPYFVMKRDQAELGIQLQDSLEKNSRRGRGRTTSREVHESRQQIKQQLLVLKQRGLKSAPEQEEKAS